MFTRIRQPQGARKDPQGLDSTRSFQIFAAVLGLAYYLLHGGLQSLNVCDIDWLQKPNDWSQHYIGWAFGRHSPWGLPFGLIPDLGYPIGTRVAYMDGNPLVAWLLRPWSMWLPEPFQYIGPWMASCLMLQGVFGVKLVCALLPKTHPRDAITILVAAMLFVVAPVLIHRLDHDTLMAQWLIVGSLWLCLERIRGDSLSKLSDRRRLMWCLGLGCIAASVHPYLLAMVAPLLLWAVFWSGQDMALCASFVGSGAGGMLAMALWLLSVMATLFFFGYVSHEDAAGSDGFGFFAADLSALFNSMGWSRLMTSLPFHPGQSYEGFGYMGLGALMLVAAACVFELRRGLLRRHHRDVLAVAIMVFGLALFSLSNHIYWLGRWVMDFRTPYGLIAPITAMLRSSGRFIWPLHYALLAMGIGVLIRETKPSMSRGLLALVLCIQLIDIVPQNVSSRLRAAPHDALVHPIWSRVAKDARHIVLIPPLFPASGALQCGPLPPAPKAEVAPAIFASEHGLTTNSVYTARIREAKTRAYCRDLMDDVSHQRYKTDSIYLIDKRLVARIVSPTSPLRCWSVDGRIGCVHHEHPNSPKVDDPLVLTSKQIQQISSES